MALPQYSATDLPPGLAINAGTGAITGSFTQVGIWKTVIREFNLVANNTKVLTFSIDPPVDSSYATWSAAFWPGAGVESTQGADPDGDGVSNLMEYALRTLPTVTSPPTAPSLSRANDGALVIEMDVGDRGDRLIWQAEFSNNLNFTAATIAAPNVVPGAAAGFTRLRFVDPGGVNEPRRTGRLRVTLP